MRLRAALSGLSKLDVQKVRNIAALQACEDETLLLFIITVPDFLDRSLLKSS